MTNVEYNDIPYKVAFLFKSISNEANKQQMSKYNREK